MTIWYPYLFQIILGTIEEGGGEEHTLFGTMRITVYVIVCNDDTVLISK